MPIVTIVKRFELTHDDGTSEVFVEGSYDLEQKLADHWYVKAHSDRPPPVRPRAGTPHYAQQMARYEADQQQLAQQEAFVADQAASSARQQFQQANPGARIRQPLQRATRLRSGGRQSLPPPEMRSTQMGDEEQENPDEMEDGEELTGENLRASLGQSREGEEGQSEGQEQEQTGEEGGEEGQGEQSQGSSRRRRR